VGFGSVSKLAIGWPTLECHDAPSSERVVETRKERAPMAKAGHTWQFVGTHVSRPAEPVVAAVCTTCGEARAARALLGPNYERLDLTGECPEGRERFKATST
jgi:hypothetical protein